MLKYILILFLFSCSGVKHWKYVATDTNVTPQKRALIAPKVAAMFPVVPTFIKGRTDTIIETLELPGDTTVITERDTVKVTVTLPQRVVTRTVVRTDTVEVENTARLHSLINDLEVCETTNISLQTLNENYLIRNAELVRKRNKGWWWFGVLALVNLIFIVYKIFRR